AQASRLATQDILLVCLELLGLWALLRVEDSRRRWPWGLLAGATVGLCFLIKSVMVVLPVVAIAPYLLQKWRIHLTNWGLYVGLVLGFIPVGVWLGLSSQRYGAVPVQQLLGKVLLLSQVAEGSNAYYPTTPFFYGWNIPANTFPWALLAIAGVVVALRSPWIDRGWLWIGYPLILLVELAAFDTRTWYYPLQIYPFLALFAALALTQLTRRYVSTAPFQRQLPLRLSWLVGCIGFVLLIAGAVLLSAPLWGIDPNLQTYGWIGIGGGLGWLVPMVIALQDGTSRWQRRGWLWQMGWLLGPGLAIAALFLSGLWGNYSPDVKTALRTAPVAPILAQHPIYFIQPDATAIGVLLTFYTPELGDRLASWEALPANAYAWGPSPIPPDYETIITLRDWQLALNPANSGE
ncbi:4-amino-4-deoxy-L-arabinose transferase, partial [filamentous cyanobacterium CCP5]